MSYDILGEDEDRYETDTPDEANWRIRAQQLYSDKVFTRTQKLALLDEKIELLKQKSPQDNIAKKLIEELEAVRFAEVEGEKAPQLKASKQQQRGPDPEGLSPYKP
ncbi:unnamed protein product [Durusdinium trenchii]|uniref:Uncharacterized protein n=1 Tax=Durusdinium trenchii TaxID=1381693 RepID=A0ABP0ITR6_9DINO